MHAQRALLCLGLATLVAGCDEPEAPELRDTGFRVVAVVPLDHDENAIESTNPELRVSAYADPSSCTTSTVHLAVVADGNSVVDDVNYELSFPDNGRKIRLEPDHALPNGYWYMLTVRSGVWGCTDTNGRMIAPFASRFFVP